MKEIKKKVTQEKDDAITEEEFNEFLSAKTQEEQINILLEHSKKNAIIVEKKMKTTENHAAIDKKIPINETDN